MNKLTALLFLLFFAALSCKKTESTEADTAPTNLALNQIVSTDSSGSVSFTAAATNAVMYTFNFGDGTTEVSVTGIVTHHYTASAVYTVTVVAKSASGKTASTTTVITVAVVQGLVWADEFDGTQLNSSKWSYELGAGGWGNNEVQYYTDRADNTVVSDGTLKIILKKESYNNSLYTSARLISHGKYSFTYGKIEVRAKLPAGGGTWPAIWMLGDNLFTGTAWPACGEIDIMEHVGNDLNKIHGSLHDPSSFGNTVNTGTTIVPGVTEDFHVYSLEWSATTIKFFVDNVPYYIFGNNTTHPFNQNFFIILNVAMGGNFGGAIDPAFVSAAMEIDYVRVYQ
ncbi:MAG: family 16 glycosylhydrolase [Bacteroidales bacterium]|nr:family 16 glycosylhydrolase [Bacteroidales bacterium]